MPTHYSGTDEAKRALDVFIKLMRASQSVRERTFEHIAAAGLSQSQFGVLETLHHLGPLTVSQLADKHLLSRNNFTTVIDNLEKKELVRRVRDQEDRRVVMVHLTETGQALIDTLLPQFVDAVLRDMQVLTPAEQEELGVLLRRLGRQ